MVHPFDKYITLILQSSVSTYTRIEGARMMLTIKAFFVKHVDIIRPLKADIYFHRLYTCLHDQAIIIKYILQQLIFCLITKFFVKRIYIYLYINDQAVITSLFLCFDIPKKLLIR